MRSPTGSRGNRLSPSASSFLLSSSSQRASKIAVLCALHRLDPRFLATVVEQDFPRLLQADWIRNVSAVVKTIGKLEGPQAPLLEVVIQRYGEQASVESLVLAVRGL
ncbi:MAG: hypothetical protein F6K04_17280 [Leptolyngbya sp. SIO4C5]|nr:hypothetical protein [Leptolyngbya sp. SIO4C5]